MPEWGLGVGVGWEGQVSGSEETLGVTLLRHFPHLDPALHICKMKEGWNSWVATAGRDVLSGLRGPANCPVSALRTAQPGPRTSCTSAAVTEKAEEKHFSTAAGTSCFQLSRGYESCHRAYKSCSQIFQTVTSQGIPAVGSTA